MKFVLPDTPNELEISSNLVTAGQPTVDALAAFRAQGGAAVINLGLLDPAYCLADEASTCASLGLDYRHIPVLWDRPEVADFVAFRQTMDAWAGRNLLVHCRLNWRATCFVALYREGRGAPSLACEKLLRTFFEPDEIWSRFVSDVRALREENE